MRFIIDNIFRNSPILLSLIAMIGLILQKKKVSEIIKGTFMAAFGMLILEQGVNILISSIIPINSAFQKFTGGTVGEGLNGTTFTNDYGSIIGIVMFIGLIIHILIARYTPIKTIFLTGHMLWWFPFIFVASGIEGGLSGVKLIIFSSVLSALYWSIMPWILRKYVSDVTNDKSFTLGHPTGLLSIIAGYVSFKFGNKSNSTENLKFFNKFSFFREISITGSFVMIIIWIIVGNIIPTLILEDKNLVMESIQKGITFGAGLIILLQGVRMLINQIVPAFKGISERLVPNAIPAFDCPIIFNYKPNAVLIGFLISMLVSTFTIIVINSLGLSPVLLLPLVITCFFECGCAAVIAEGQGGLRGCIIGTSISAIVMVMFLGISVLVYSNTISNWMMIFGGNDFSIFGFIAKYLAQIINMVI